MDLAYSKVHGLSALAVGGEREIGCVLQAVLSCEMHPIPGRDMRGGPPTLAHCQPSNCMALTETAEEPWHFKL